MLGKTWHPISRFTPKFPASAPSDTEYASVPSDTEYGKHVENILTFAPTDEVRKALVTMYLLGANRAWYGTAGHSFRQFSREFINTFLGEGVEVEL